VEKDAEKNCSFSRGNNRFRYRACAIIIEDGCVLMATNEAVDYYYSVGGAVHLGETATQAVVREVFEETGLYDEVDRLAFVHENLFQDDETKGSLKGLACHEIAFYFLMKPRGMQEITAKSFCIDGEEFMKWMPLGELKNIKAYPSFYAQKLLNLPDGVEHIVSN